MLSRAFRLAYRVSLVNKQAAVGFMTFSGHFSSMPRYLNQQEATQIDEELFNECNFSVDQLMELAGLSCASAIVDAYPALKNKKLLVCVGPGNNGGDGLVCARHLKLFGYEPEIFYPKRPQKDLYIRLTKQCELCEIPFISACPELDAMNSTYSLVIDALFGFSFKPPVRPEFIDIINNLVNCSVPICSVDIPSGWDVDKGPGSGNQVLNPEMLVSLTAPKGCAKDFKGKFHYLGGLFIPEKMAKKYQLDLPLYTSTNCMRLS